MGNLTGVTPLPCLTSIMYITCGFQISTALSSLLASPSMPVGLYGVVLGRMARGQEAPFLQENGHHSRLLNSYLLCNHLEPLRNHNRIASVVRSITPTR